MTQNQLADVLREESRSNPVAHAVFLMFATRERARNDVTLSGLTARMIREGFNFEMDAYAKILRFLSQLGFGRLETTPKNRVIALRDVRVTLQSIGAVALGNTTALTGFKPRNKFVKLVVDAKQAVKPSPKKVLQVAPAPASGKTITVTLNVNGKPITIQMPADTSTEDLAKVIVRLHD